MFCVAKRGYLFTAGLTLLAPLAGAAVLTETWDTATAGALTAPGTLAADNTWSLAVEGTPGPVEVAVESVGDHAVSHAATGSGGSSRFWLAAPLSAGVNLDTHAVHIEFDVTFNDVLDNGDRHTIFQLYSAAGEGYQVRFSGNQALDKVVLDFDRIAAGLPLDAAVDVGPIPPGQFAAKLYRARVNLSRSGADTLMDYEVENLTDGGFLVPADTATFAANGVAAGTILSDFRLGFRRRSQSRIDNIAITAVSLDSTPPVITRNGAASVSVACNATYTDAGATANDNVDGTLTGSIVTVNPVNTAVPGVYTVTYNVSDAAGNAAVEVTRSVTVQDNCDGIKITATAPATLLVEEGGSATFSIEATGSGTLSYDWFFDDGSKAPVPVGATTPSLTIAPVFLTDAGTYYCTVTDDFTSLDSPLFTLNVTAELPVAGLPLLGLGALAMAFRGVAGLRRKA
jgi:PKD repeat protein